MKAYYEKNKEKIKAMAKVYYVKIKKNIMNFPLYIEKKIKKK